MVKEPLASRARARLSRASLVSRRDRGLGCVCAYGMTPVRTSLLTVLCQAELRTPATSPESGASEPFQCTELFTALWEIPTVGRVGGEPQQNGVI